MEEMELKSIWNAYDKKLERSLKLSMRLLEGIQKDKAKSKLDSLVSIKIFGIAIGVIWVLFLGLLIYGNHFKNVYFSTSVAMIMFFSIIAIAAYIRHIVLISQIDYTESITTTQTRLAELQVSTINSTRFVWLQLPFYTTFFWNQDWMNKDIGFWLIAFPITWLFTAIAIWLYKSIAPENLHKPWVKKFMMIGMEYKYALSASELLREIEEFKKE
jgi:hypothetical protein